MKKKHISTILGIIAILNLGCTVKKENENLVINEHPKYEKNIFISLDKLYTINIGTLDDKYYLSDASWMDIDDSDNLYILDAYESKFHVFDQNGVHLRTFGGRGEGPSELYQPRCFSISKEKIFVLEKFRGIKVFNLFGEYIKYILPENLNLASFKAFEDFIICQSLTIKFEKPILGEPDIRQWDITKYSNDFKKELQISKLIRHFNFFNYISKTLVNSIDSGHNIYLPYSDDEYLVNKYDSNGKKVLSFSRKYDRLHYSKQLKDWAKKKFGNKIIIPKYPPIVRCIYVDDNDYIWVLVGECYLDSSSDIRVESIVDIFNKKGEYLYKLKSDVFSNMTVIKKGKLYSGPNAPGDNKVKVYKILYSGEEGDVMH